MLISSDVNLHPALVQMRVTLFFDAAIAMLISSEVSFDLQLIFTLPPALRMLIISLVNFINNNFLNSTVVKVVIKNKGRIHFSNNFKIRHFIFIRVCSLTNKCIKDGSNIISPACGLGTKSPLKNIQSILNTLKQEETKINA